jgi:hypothetical protein
LTPTDDEVDPSYDDLAALIAANRASGPEYQEANLSRVENPDTDVNHAPSACSGCAGLRGTHDAASDWRGDRDRLPRIECDRAGSLPAALPAHGPRIMPITRFRLVRLHESN